MANCTSRSRRAPYSGTRRRPHGTRDDERTRSGTTDWNRSRVEVSNRTQKSPPLRRSPLELMLEAGWDGAGGSRVFTHVTARRACSTQPRVLRIAALIAKRQVMCVLQRAASTRALLFVAGGRTSL